VNFENLSPVQREFLSKSIAGYSGTVKITSTELDDLVKRGIIALKGEVIQFSAEAKAAFLKSQEVKP
jgi:hypothetical protein